MGYKPNMNKLLDDGVPGPGAYAPVLPRAKSNILIGKGHKGSLVEKESLYKPGPGKYE